MFKVEPAPTFSEVLVFVNVTVLVAPVNGVSVTVLLLFTVRLLRVTVGTLEIVGLDVIITISSVDGGPAGLQLPAVAQEPPPPDQVNVVGAGVPVVVKAPEVR